MPSLQVREMPENLYRRLVNASKKEHRSIAQEAIVLLANSLEVNLSPKERRKKVLDSLTDFHRKINKTIKIKLIDRKERVEAGCFAPISLVIKSITCLLYTSPSPRDLSTYRMPSSA